MDHEARINYVADYLAKEIDKETEMSPASKKVAKVGILLVADLLRDIHKLANTPGR